MWSVHENTENHQHLFTDYKYCTYLWKELLLMLDLLPTTAPTLRQQFSDLRRNFPTKSATQALPYVAASSTTHHIWLGRVRHRFEVKSCSVEQRAKLIEIDIRL